MKLEGQITRGKTAHNRLRRVDTFLMMYDAPLIRRVDGLFAHAMFVDVGFGAEPITTLESASRLRQIAPTLPVLGVEIDPERVAAAQPFADELTHFRLGGFNLPLNTEPPHNESVRLIRAFNVLRQYDESAVLDAHQRLSTYVLPGGLMIEGTSDPYGRLWVANLLRRNVAWTSLSVSSEARNVLTTKAVPTSLPVSSEARNTSWYHEGLVFSTNFRWGFDPKDFQAVLPKNHIHHMVSGEPIYTFFELWKQATRETVAMKTWGLRQWFVASAERLAEYGQSHGFVVNTQKKWLQKGFLIVSLPLL
ncbi:MAG: methylase [Chloroflexota bacterium]